MITKNVGFFTKEEDGFIKNWYSSENLEIVFWEKNDKVDFLKLIKKNHEDNEVILDYNDSNGKITFYKTEIKNENPLKNNSELLAKIYFKDPENFISEFINHFKEIIKVNHFLELMKVKKIIETKCI